MTDAINWAKPIETVDGRKARVICDDLDGSRMTRLLLVSERLCHGECEIPYYVKGDGIAWKCGHSYRDNHVALRNVTPPQPAPLVIEEGRCYRTRDGRKAGIIRWSNGSWVGDIDGEGSRHWNKCGRWAYGDCGQECPADLIAPWTEQNGLTDTAAVTDGPAPERSDGRDMADMRVEPASGCALQDIVGYETILRDDVAARFLSGRADARSSLKHDAKLALDAADAFMAERAKREAHDD